MAPPSKHKFGNEYVWEISCHIEDFDIVELPHWLLNLLKDIYVAPVPTLTISNNSKIIEGQRNNYLCSIAGMLQRKGVAKKTLSMALLTENQEHCNPPLHEKEVENIIKSISKYKSGTPPSTHYNLSEDAFYGLSPE